MISIFEIITSSVSAILFILISLYGISRERSVTSVAFCITAILIAVVEISDMLSLALFYNPLEYKRAALFFESLMPASFLFFSFTYARRNIDKSILLIWKLLLAATIIFPVCIVAFSIDKFFFAPDLQTEKMLFLGSVGYWFYMGMMISCILALMNLEATFSTASESEKWKIKFEFAGMTAIFAIFIFYYSQGLLYRTINMNLIPIRSAVLIIAAILIGYSKIFRGNGVQISVSRYIFYRSLTVLIVGLYLLVLGLIGEGMKYMGVSFSRDLTIFIAFAMGTFMVLVLLSGRIRRRATVFINKNFFRHKYDYRHEWLKFSERLALCKRMDEVENAILMTYMETFGLKGAILYLLDSATEHYVLAAERGAIFGRHSLPVSAELIRYFEEQARVFNKSADEYIPTDEEMSFLSETRARLIVPMFKNGSVIGLILLGDQLAKDKITYEDYDLMKTLAKQASLSIINLKLSEELGEAREVAAVSKISSFVIHDLKNLASSLSLLLDNAGAYIENKEFQSDMLETIKNTVAKMNSLTQQLRKIPEKQVLNTGIADIYRLAQETTDEVRKLNPGVELVCEGSASPSLVDTDEIKKVILNLILNAIDACDGKGTIRIKTGDKGNMGFLSVEDNGCGIEEDFIHKHLFKPFRTTKKKGLGIGLYQCKQIIEAHGGRIDVHSKAGSGTVFTVFLAAAVNYPVNAFE